jgi:fluoroacetyl-CoA thioesterase
VTSESEGLVAGLEARVEATVTEDMTAVRIGSGDVPVLATPTVVALIERAAVEALSGRLAEGQTSVGTSMALDHLAPTPEGRKVAAVARLEVVDGRRLSFGFEVSDQAGVVARGTHSRVLVDREWFLRTASARV